MIPILLHDIHLLLFKFFTWALVDSEISFYLWWSKPIKIYVVLFLLPQLLSLSLIFPFKLLLFLTEIGGNLTSRFLSLWRSLHVEYKQYSCCWSGFHQKITKQKLSVIELRNFSKQWSSSIMLPFGFVFSRVSLDLMNGRRPKTRSYTWRFLMPMFSALMTWLVRL